MSPAPAGFESCPWFSFLDQLATEAACGTVACSSNPCRAVCQLTVLGLASSKFEEAIFGCARIELASRVGARVPSWYAPWAPCNRRVSRAGLRVQQTAGRTKMLVSLLCCDPGSELCVS